MKVTEQHIEAFLNKSGLIGTYLDIKTALQAVFDTFPTEPTPEQINRAIDAFDHSNSRPIKDVMRETLRAAMTEPPPKVYPYAEQLYGSRYITIYIDSATYHSLFLPPFMEFDYEKLEMRLKK